MKAECLSENLKVALAIAGRAVKESSVLPVLSNVLISANGEGRLELSATNLEIGIRVWIAAQIEEGGDLTVPARTFTDLVDLLGEGRVALTIREKPTLHVSCNKTEANIKGIPAEEFPVITDYTQVEGCSELTIEPDALTKAVKRTVTSASKEAARPVLQAVYFHAENGKLSLASADGFRLSYQPTEIPYDGPGLLIPQAAVSLIQRFLSLAGQKEPVRIIVNAKATQVAIIFENVHLVSQMYDGHFPNYRQIVPETRVVRLSISTSALRQAIKSALVYTKGYAAKGTHWAIGDGEITVSGESVETGEATSTIKCDVEGEWGDGKGVSLNGLYVLDVLGAIDTDVVTIDLVGSSQPVVFRPGGEHEDGYIHVIMPQYRG